jgi:hypothetical protein
MMPNREKELSLHTRFLVLGVVSSIMISVLFLAAFSSGPHFSAKYGAIKKSEHSGMKIVATRAAS